jgi:hypothetical protein
MKAIGFFLLLFTFAFSAVQIQATPATPTAVYCGGDSHGGASKMTLQVKKVIKNDEKAAALKSSLMALNGVKDVSVCTESGNVKVSYDKAQLGCCSKIHTALKDNNWKYKMVSNEEVPACSSGAKKGCSHSEKKGV